MSPPNRGSPGVTAVIAAHDESANIEACIASLERCTPELAQEIQDKIRTAEYQAFRVPRRNFFLGKEIRHGGWGRGNDTPIRLFRRDLRYNANQVHEHVDVPVGAQTGELRTSLLHYTYTSLDHYFEKFDRYSRWWAEQNFARARRGTAAGVFFKPPARFVSMYLLKGGFRDGARGLVLASLAAASVMAKHPHLLECRSAMNTEIRALL